MVVAARPHGSCCSIGASSVQADVAVGPATAAGLSQGGLVKQAVVYPACWLRLWTFASLCSSLVSAGSASATGTGRRDR